ncbi:hypothetical protein ACHAP4_007582 [Fusarium culmorum]
MITDLYDRTTTVSVTNVEVVIPPIPTVTITRTLSVSTVYLYRPNQKREASLETVLASLEKKYSKAAVTAGCSCVYDPTTETVTQTTDATAEATSQVTIGPSTTVIVTKIKYIPVTKATGYRVTEMDLYRKGYHRHDDESDMFQTSDMQYERQL